MTAHLLLGRPER